LLLRKAVEQPVTASRDKVGLAAAARLMRGIPGARELIIGEASSVNMTKHRFAEFAARPVVAGHVDIARKSAPIAIGARQGIVPIGSKADA
jgi:hypothetical protein